MCLWNYKPVTNRDKAANSRPPITYCWTDPNRMRWENSCRRGKKVVGVYILKSGQMLLQLEKGKDEH